MTIGFNYSLRKEILADVDNNLLTSAEILKKSIQEKFTPLDIYLGKIRDILPKDLKIAIINKSGVLIYKNNFNDKFIIFNQEDREKFIKNKIIFKTIEDDRMVIVPYFFYGEIHFLIIGNDIKKLQKISKDIVFTFFIIIFSLIILYLVSSNYIMTKILKAVKSIGLVAQRIEKNNLQLRIEQKYNTKEIDELIDIFNNMLDRVEDAFKRVSQFTSDVSHELKTPITSIKSMIEVELISNRTNEEYKDSMINILEEIDWLSSIINDLLMMTHMEAGTESLEFSHINLKEVVEDIVEILEFLAEKDNIEIITNDVENITINADKNKIKRMILNIGSNSIKYNKPNGKLYISIKKENEYAKIIFKDTGIGIKKENISRIFERFYREDKVRTSKKSGTGLGLSIVSFIVKMHNGKIDIRSEEGEGTEFEILLPLNANIK